MGPRNAVLGGGDAGMGGWEEGGGRGGRRSEERGAPSLQNEDPTPQDGWEKHSKQDGGITHVKYLLEYWAPMLLLIPKAL